MANQCKIFLYWSSIQFKPECPTKVESIATGCLVRMFGLFEVSILLACYLYLLVACSKTIAAIVGILIIRFWTQPFHGHTVRLLQFSPTLENMQIR